MRWKGRWALITGASAGIGLAFAEQLAAEGVNLVLSARRVERLQETAGKLRTAHGVKVEWVSADLARDEGAQQIFAYCQARGIAVDLLINNAGIGTYGEFSGVDPKREALMVQVNCTAVAQVTHLFLPRMVKQGRGDILIVSSTAAFQAVPYMAVYAATKTFDLIFAEALAQEVRRHGVRVCALCPGSTESEFDLLAGIPTERTATIETAQKVAQAGLSALMAGRHTVISGFTNWALAQVQRIAPRRVAAAVTEKMFRPDSVNPSKS